MSDYKFNALLVFLIKLALVGGITKCAIEFENYHLLWWYLVLFARIRLGGDKEEPQKKTNYWDDDGGY